MFYKLVFFNLFNMKTMFRIVLLMFTGLVFSFCKQEPQIWEKKSLEQLAGDYIASNPDHFSEFDKLIEATDKIGRAHV